MTLCWVPPERLANSLIRENCSRSSRTVIFLRLRLRFSLGGSSPSGRPVGVAGDSSGGGTGEAGVESARRGSMRGGLRAGAGVAGDAVAATRSGARAGSDHGEAGRNSPAPCRWIRDAMDDTGFFALGATAVSSDASDSPSEGSQGTNC